MHWFETDVLNPQQQLQLARWVARADPDWRQPQLLFRASRDGFCSAAFHQKCDRKGATVVLARETNGDLFGGYTDMTWDCKKGWKQCKHAFLFSFAFGALPCAHPIVLNRKEKITGILCDDYHGACFGALLGMTSCDMDIFRCGASTSARFCPGRAYHCGSGADESRSSRNIDQVEVFAVRASNRAPAPIVSGYDGFDGVAPRNVPSPIFNPEIFQSHLPSAPTASIPPVPCHPIFHPEVFQSHLPTASIPPVPCRKGGQQTQGPHAEETQNSDSVQCSHFGMPDHARFCMDCGQRLKRSRSRSRTRSPEPPSKLHVDQLDLEIVGFKLPSEEEHADHLGDEALWDHFRARLMDFHATTSEVKEEIEETGDIVTVPIAAVYNLQQRCSRHFRDGRPLEQTIQQLKSGQVNELHHPNFVLNVAKAVLDNRATYYTFDHRRLLCMRLAGKQHVRVRIRLAGRAFDEFARKARERLGRHDDIQVNKSYY